MNFPISLYIALRYWRAKSADRFGRLVTNLASLGIVLGVMALIIVLSVMNGLEGYQKQQVLSSIPHAIVSEEQPICPKSRADQYNKCDLPNDKRRECRTNYWYSIIF